MGFRERFRRKKKEKETTTVQTSSPLEQICRDDAKTYEALQDTMFLDPRKVGVTMEEAAENAKKFEKAKDSVSARIWYEVAGGMAIYQGDTKKVVEYFSQVEKIAPGTKSAILKDPQKAVDKAQEYYRNCLGLKPETTT